MWALTRSKLWCHTMALGATSWGGCPQAGHITEQYGCIHDAGPAQLVFAILGPLWVPFPGPFSSSTAQGYSTCGAVHSAHILLQQGSSAPRLLTYTFSSALTVPARMHILAIPACMPTLWFSSGGAGCMLTHMVQHWWSRLLAYPFGSALVVLLACVSIWFPACLRTPSVQHWQSHLLAYPFGSPPAYVPFGSALAVLAACAPILFSTGGPACLHTHLVQHWQPRLHVYPFGSALTVPACLHTHLVQHWQSRLHAYPFGSALTVPACLHTHLVQHWQSLSLLVYLFQEEGMDALIPRGKGVGGCIHSLV
jgi:hypothetical protein